MEKRAHIENIAPKWNTGLWLFVTCWQLQQSMLQLFLRTRVVVDVGNDYSPDDSKHRQHNLKHSFLLLHEVFPSLMFLLMWFLHLSFQLPHFFASRTEITGMAGNRLSGGSRTRFSQYFQVYLFQLWIKNNLDTEKIYLWPSYDFVTISSISDIKSQKSIIW